MAHDRETLLAILKIKYLKMKTKIFSPINLAFLIKLKQYEMLNLFLRKSLLLILYFNIITNVNAQKTWDTIYDHDPINVISQTYNNNFITSGVSKIGMELLWSTMQLNPYGKKLYDTTFWSGQGQIFKIKPTSDSGYILLGYEQSNGISYMYILKNNKSNKFLWEKEYCPFGGAEDLINIPAGYAIFGIDSGNLAILKLNSIGDSVWSKKYNAISVNKITLIKTFDSGYYFLGSKNLLNCLFQTNNKGDSVWIKATDSVFGLGNNFVLTSDSCLIICGNNTLTKTDLNGNVRWSKSYYWNDPYVCNKIISTYNGNFITIYDAIETDRSLILSINNNGDTIWSRTIFHYQATDVIQASDSMFLVTGFSSYLGWVAKFDSLGKGLNIFSSVQEATLDNNAVIRNYPNPFITSTTINWHLPEWNLGTVTIRIKNLLGQLLLEKTINGKNSMIYAPENNISGLLIVELKTKSNFYTKKILRIK